MKTTEQLEATLQALCRLIEQNRIHVRYLISTTIASQNIQAMNAQFISKVLVVLKSLRDASAICEANERLHYAIEEKELDLSLPMEEAMKFLDTVREEGNKREHYNKVVTPVVNRIQEEVKGLVEDVTPPPLVPGGDA